MSNKETGNRNALGFSEEVFGSDMERLEAAKRELNENFGRENFGKQMLAIRIANEILISENFLEAYPDTSDAEKIKKVLTRVLWKNGVSTEDGRKFFLELSENYQERAILRK